MKRTTAGPIDLLLIGPGADELDALRKRAVAAGRKLRLHGVADTGLAVAFLIQHSPYELAPRPDLIVLDVDLSQAQDREFLQHLKRSEALRTIPLVTLAERGEAVLRAYQLGANCQMPRPADLASWDSLIATLEQFWTRVATLPTRIAGPEG
jgi:chemotaxis family two-component system response regulator Rcp1